VTATAAFGRWPSTFGAEEAASARSSKSALRSDGADLYWLESRPEEGGRHVVVRLTGTSCRDVGPDDLNVRSTVNEYGGGAYCLVAPARPGAPTRVAVVERGSQRIMLVDGEHMEALSAPPEGAPAERHGDLSADPAGSWVLAVRERHGDRAPRRDIVAYRTDPGSALDARREPVVLVSGHDFFSAPRLDHEGRRLAWVSWDHPDMPWDASTLWVAPLHTSPTGRLERGEARAVAGGRAPGPPGPTEDCSVGQPQWLAGHSSM
jgi:dipeptidyl aminopeptidase/acylaminoacyl peptidase